MESIAVVRPIAQVSAPASVAADLGEFYRSEFSRIVGAVFLYCGERELAHDVVQEAMARACRDWSKVQRLDSPGAWVYRVAMNLAASWHRRNAVARRHEATRRDSQAEPETAQAVALRQAIALLPPRQRQALVLRYFADLSVHDAAVVMGCATGTVKALTAQAVRALRDAGLANEEESDE